MSISAAEFEALQLQLIELKEAKYENQDREKKLLNEIKSLKEHVSTLETDLKKAQADPSTKFSLSGVMSKSKDKKEIAALMSENEALSRNLELATQEHREQQEATMQNVKNLYATNKVLEEEIENYKKIALEKDRKMEVQEGQIRKFQIQLLQFETSADLNKSSGSPEGAPKEGEASESNGAENHHDASSAGKYDEENARLRENVRLLSAQLKDIDAQLSKSEDSYRSQIESLEQQVAADREKIKQDEIASARMEARLEEELTKLLKDKEELITKLSNWEQQGKKDKGLTDQVGDLKEEVADLSDKLSTLKISRDGYMEQAKKVTSEFESVSQQKDALDAKLLQLEAEVELLRKVRDDHSTALNELENSKSNIKNLQIALDRANLECSELKEVKSELEQARQDLESATLQANTLQAELDALKLEIESLREESKKIGPLEQELEQMKLAHLQAVTESGTYKEQYDAERLKLIDLESSLQDTTTKLAEANEQVGSLTAQVNQLQTEKDDLITEHRIEDRKSQRMIKELKSELQKERSSISRSMSMEQIPSVPPSPATSTQRHSPPMSPVQPLTPPPHSTPRLNRKQAEAVNALPLVSANLANLELSPSTMEEILRRDLDTALTMVGKLGEDKWKLEEKTRFLEENLALLNEDLVRKTKVIQHYVGKTKMVVTAEQAERERGGRRQSGVRGTLLRAGNDQELSVELLSKMEAVLEETVLRNVQLQNDLVTLGNETGLLQNEIKQLKETNQQITNENSHYKEQLVRIMSTQH